jgi:hypothetical protein
MLRDRRCPRIVTPPGRALGICGLGKATAALLAFITVDVWGGIVWAMRHQVMSRITRKIMTQMRIHLR